MLFRASSPRRRVLITVLAGVFAVSAVGAVPAPYASAATTYGLAQPLTFAPGVEYVSPAATAVAVSCWSPGNCVTVGNFVNADNRETAFTARSTNGVWAQAVPTEFPDGMQSDPGYSWLLDVDCTTPGDCTAVGRFTPAAGGQRAFAIELSDNAWADPIPVPLPEGSGNSEFSAVSCAAAGNCSAVGNFWDPSGYRHGLLATSTGGTWGEGSAAVFDDGIEPLDTFTNTMLLDIDCPTADSCTAVGQVGFDGLTAAFTVSAVSGAWQHAQVATFDDSIARAPEGNRNDRLAAVSCAAPGECTAAGRYADLSGEEPGLVGTVAFTLTSTAGVWGDATPAIPSDASVRWGHSGKFNSISCTAPGTCTAVGAYTQTFPSEDPFTTEPSIGQTPLVRSSVDGVWGPATRPPGVKAFRNRYTDTGEFKSVSCTSPGNCTAVGTNLGGNPAYANVIGSMTNGAWATLTGSSLAPDSPEATYGSVGLTSIDCTSLGECTAVGFYIICPPELREEAACWRPSYGPTPRANTNEVISDESASSRAFAVRTRYRGSLPPTGSNTNISLTIGLALCAGGALMTLRRRRAHDLA